MTPIPLSSVDDASLYCVIFYVDEFSKWVLQGA